MRGTVLKRGVMAFMVLVLVSGLMLGCAQPAPAPAPAPVPAPAPKPPPPPAPAPTPAPPGQIVWRLDTILAPGRVDTVYIKQTCDEILELSEGRLKIEVYPALSLKLNPLTAFSNIRDGLCEISALFAQIAEGEEESFAVVEAHGIWDSKEQNIRAAEAIIPFKKKVLAEQWNSVFIVTAPNIVRRNQMLNKVRPIKSLEDVKGLKVRVPSARQLEIWKAVGAAPELMPLPDVYMGLKTGLVDGISSANTAFVSNKHYEIAKYVVNLTAAEAVCLDIVINKDAWDALPDDLKEVVTSTFEAYYARLKATILSGTWDGHFQRALENEGVEFTDLSEKDLAGFREVATQVHNDFLAKAKPRTLEAWEIVKPIVLGE